MASPNILYSTLLMTAGVVCLVVAVIIWYQRRAATGAPALIALMLALGWWDLTYAVFWAGAPGPTPTFWLDITYVGVVLVPAAFLAFTLQFALVERWTGPSIVGVLAIEPALVLALLWTDQWHGLFFAGRRTLNAGMILNAGPVFWANVAYSYLLLLLACALLLRRHQRAAGLYRRQAALVLGAAGVPWLSSLLFILGLSPLPNADNTPFAFSLTALIFGYAVLRYRMLDVMPIARDTLVEIMDDGVIVIDDQSRVVDINPAAQRAIGAAARSPVGLPIAQAFSAWPHLVAAIRDSGREQVEVVLAGDPGRHLDLRISPLIDRRRRRVGRLIVWRDITEIKRAQAELQELATRDVLTQLYNRRYFLELAAAELKRAQRLGRSMALVVADIDHFKRVNDTFGHAGGDQVLASFARTCQQHIREVDLFARFGGEEFVLLLPETDERQASVVAERLRLAVERSAIDLGAGEVSITLSLGVATLAGPQDTLEALLHRADQALYAAKQMGRDRVMLWSPQGALGEAP